MKLYIIWWHDDEEEYDIINSVIMRIFINKEKADEYMIGKSKSYELEETTTDD